MTPNKFYNDIGSERLAYPTSSSPCPIINQASSHGTMEVFPKRVPFSRVEIRVRHETLQICTVGARYGKCLTHQIGVFLHGPV